MSCRSVQLKINNLDLVAKEGQTILSVAREYDIFIPTLCYHPDLKNKFSCRLCLVSIKGRSRLYTACSTKVESGMEVITESPEIWRVRKINLELIFAQHREECGDCVIKHNCQLLKLAKLFKVNMNRLVDRKVNFPVYNLSPTLLFDSSKCIDCGNCVDICRKQGIDFLEKKQQSTFFQVQPTVKPNKKCIDCGQCLVHCPVGAFETASQLKEVCEVLNDTNKKVVFQLSPLVGLSLGEEFDLGVGVDLTAKIVTALKSLGGYKVFSLAEMSQLLVFLEAEDLIHRKLSNKNVPLFSAFCPSWVEYLKFFMPIYTKNLTKLPTPAMFGGEVVKAYLARQYKVNIQDIVMVSITPCTAHKSEAVLQHKVSGAVNSVDFVLTVRELARIFYNQKININELAAATSWDVLLDQRMCGVGDNRVGNVAGSLAENVLGAVYSQLTGCSSKQLKIKSEDDGRGIKITRAYIQNKWWTAVSVTGVANAQKILQILKANPTVYDYVEVFACFGGCAGGGGQPLPTNKKISEQRARMLNVNKGGVEFDRQCFVDIIDELNLGEVLNIYRDYDKL